MSRLFFVLDGGEMVKRRAQVPKGSVVEAWPDMQVGGGTFWVGEESKSLLDAAGPAPMPASVSVPADAVPIFYGPQLCDLESLPREESLRARVLSARGVAVAWVTLNPMGERTTHEPKSLDEPEWPPTGELIEAWHEQRLKDAHSVTAFMRYLKAFNLLEALASPELADSIQPRG